MKIDYEIEMRWEIAKHAWSQIKGMTCITTSSIAQDSECEESDLWTMYEVECKSGDPSYRMATSGCSVTFDTFQTEMFTFVGANEKVQAMLKEFDKKVEDLKKVFTNDYVELIVDALKTAMIDDGKQLALTDDQATSIIAHETLMNSVEYQEFVEWYRFWAMGVHYLRVQKYQIYVGAGIAVIVLLLLLGGGSSGAQQTVVIKKD